MRTPNYRSIVRHYEECLQRHGSGPRAVDWNSETDAAIRYDVMLGLIRDRSAPASLLDVGCGTGDLVDHMARRGLESVSYTGLDISPGYVAKARERHPETTFHCIDLLAGPHELPPFDYVVMNGVFTRRENLSTDEMMTYMADLTEVAFGLGRIGLAFNVMSKCVDWENEALFHPSLADVASVVCGRLSRHFTLRNDYGLYECTCYVYREPVR